MENLNDMLQDTVQKRHSSGVEGYFLIPEGYSGTRQ